MKIISYSINREAAPKSWERFKKWHAECCKNDPLTAAERFEKEGFKDDHSRAKKKVK